MTAVSRPRVQVGSRRRPSGSSRPSEVLELARRPRPAMPSRARAGRSVEELYLTRFALFISGMGRGAIELLSANALGSLQSKPVVVISTFPGAKALEVAAEQDIPTYVFERRDFSSKNDFERAIARACEEQGVQYVLLSGYIPRVEQVLLEKYPNRIVNIHPSLLPSFKGKYAIQQALDYGVKVTGITIHYVNEEIDEGRIIDQTAIRVEDGDSFESIDEKVFSAGVKLMINAINTVFARPPVSDS